MWEFIVMLAGLLASPILAFSYVPQIVSLAKTKNTDGISLSFWYILDASLLMLGILAIDSGSLSLIIAQGLNLGLALVVTIQVLVYRKK